MVGKKFWLSAITELSKKLPHNMWVTSLVPQFMPTPLLRIDGKTDGDFKDIEAFQKTLDSSPYFTNVTIIKAEKIRANVGDIGTGARYRGISSKPVDPRSTREPVNPRSTRDTSYRSIDAGITTEKDTEKKDLIEFTIEASFKEEQVDRIAVLVPPEGTGGVTPPAAPRRGSMPDPEAEEFRIRREKRR